MKLEQANAMTLQELVDYGINKIVEQGKRCTVAYGSLCIYGDRQGNHCYIGWLLDEDDEELMNYTGRLYYLVSNHPHKIPDLVKEYYILFNALQSFHDEKEFLMVKLNHLKSDFRNVVNFNNPNFEKWIELSI